MNKRNPHHYSSGGYGKLIKLNFTRDLKLFQKYMSSIISVEHIYIGDRISRSGISYLEYIPNSIGQSTRLENINFLNAFIQFSVSDLLNMRIGKIYRKIFVRTYCKITLPLPK